MTTYETQLLEIVKSDTYILSILAAVETLHLNDCWVAAGLIRNKVWDDQDNKTTRINDIDVIYFDSSDTSVKTEKGLEETLAYLMPDQPWSVKNQARMHFKNEFDCFHSSYDGVAHFPETPTAVAMNLHKGVLQVMAPYGLDDLFKKIVRPTPFFRSNQKAHSIYRERMKKKKWDDIWSDLIIRY